MKALYTKFQRASQLLVALLVMLALSTPAAAQTWTGAGTVWNTASNWSPAVIPNSTIADINFPDDAFLRAVTITSSVSARSLSYSNATRGYSLTSSAGVTLSSVNNINVAAGAIGLVTIDLANVATGSLLFPSGFNLGIDNNSTAAGTTLLIGPNTVIGTPGGGGVSVSGVGTTEISGSFATGGNAVIGSVTMNGPGTLILSNAWNSYSGGTFVNGGTLRLGSGTAIPTGSNVTVGAGQFNIGSLSNSATTAIGLLALTGSGTFRVPSGSGDYVITELSTTGGTVDFTGTSNFWLHLKGVPAPGDPTRSYGIDAQASSTTVTWNGAPNSRIQNDSGRELYLSIWTGTTPSGIDLEAGIALSSGVGSGAVGSNPNLLKWGSGVMRLNSLANTANINIGQGAVRVDDVTTNGVGTLGTGAITVAGGELIYGGPSATMTKNLTLDNVNIYFCCGGQIQVLTPGTDLNYTGTISESRSNMGLYVYGPGANSAPSTLTLNNNNSYTGSTVVYDNAILSVPTISNLGQASPIGTDPTSKGITLGSTVSRGTLLLTGTSPAYSTNRGVAVNGIYSLGAGGGIDVRNAATSLTLAGQITGSGSLIKTGAGTLTLTNTTNSYTGGTYIEAGTLVIGGAGAVIPVTGNVSVLADAFLDLHNNNVTINALEGGSSVINNFASGAHTLTLGNGNGSGTFGGTINSGPTLNVVKTGSGTQVFSGANTYAGSTTINAGALAIDGSIPGDVAVNSGGTLQGIGSIGGNVTLASGGVLSPGDSPGTLTVGSLTLNSGSRTTIQLGGTEPSAQYDRLVVSGAVSLDGTLEVLLFGPFMPVSGHSFDILDWSGSPTGSFSTLQLPALSVGLTWNTSQLYTAGILSVGLPGDYNANGIVDGADYVVWRKGLGTTYSQNDYNVWRSNFGSTAGSGTGTSLNAAVPEPASALLMVAGAVMGTFEFFRTHRNPECVPKLVNV